MQKMTGLDLEFAVADMQALCGKRIAKIRKTEEGVYLFKIGTEEILFEPGIRLHITRQVLKATDAPDGFVAFLRKNLEGKTAQTIAKREGERIVEITSRSKERLIFELFRKGNLILVGEDGNVYACLLREDAGGRRIERGVKYEYPKATPFAAKAPSAVAFSCQENERGEPISYSCDAAKGGKQFATFSEAADHYYSNAKEESGAEKAAAEKVKALQARLESQKEALAKIEAEQKEAKLEGDAVYANYEKIEKLLAIVREMRKQGKSDEWINREIAKFGAKVSGPEIEMDAQ